MTQDKTQLLWHCIALYWLHSPLGISDGIDDGSWLGWSEGVSEGISLGRSDGDGESVGGVGDWASTLFKIDRRSTVVISIFVAPKFVRDFFAVFSKTFVIIFEIIVEKKSDSARA